MTAGTRRRLVAISLKMYFDPQQTMAWTRRIAHLASTHRVMVDERVRLVVFPSMPVLAAVRAALADTPVQVGAQDLFQEDRGPFTGAVSGADLHQLGVRYAEVGHVERRRLFGDDEKVVALKMRAAWRNRLVPLLCVGEDDAGTADDAAREVVRQLDSALSETEAGARSELVVAYEPTWAIGGDAPAGSDHIARVATALRRSLDGYGLPTASVIYGGSARTDMMRELDGVTDGLFLGRFAHDPAVLRGLLDEMMSAR